MPLPDFPLALETATIHQVAAATYTVFEPVMTAYENALVGAFPTQVASLRGVISNVTHPYVKEMPLMDPVDLSFLLVSYFVALGFFYLVGRVTGKLELRAFGILYNFVCVLMSLYMSVGLAWECYNTFDTLWNNPADETKPRAYYMRNIMWVFYFSKFIEYTDTFIMVLKHNYRQVSFLHLYHHSSIVIVAYSFFINAPGGDGYWSSMVNSGIHVVMYAYYLLNLLFRTGPVKAFLQRNKLIITVGQLTQFALNMVQALYVLFIVETALYPRWIMASQIAYMATMIALFGNFLIKNNSGAKKRSSSSGKKAAVAGKPKRE